MTPKGASKWSHSKTRTALQSKIGDELYFINMQERVAKAKVWHDSAAQTIIEPA